MIFNISYKAIDIMRAVQQILGLNELISSFIVTLKRSSLRATG